MSRPTTALSLTSLNRLDVFQPSGDHFASVGSDGKLLIYDGSTGDFVSSLSHPDKEGHKGTIFALSWSKDSKFISTSGADKTVKVRHRLTVRSHRKSARALADPHLLANRSGTSRNSLLFKIGLSEKGSSTNKSATSGVQTPAKRSSACHSTASSMSLISGLQMGLVALSMAVSSEAT